VILPVWDDDLPAMMMSCATGTLEPAAMNEPSRSAVCVVLAADGYPGDYAKGITLTEHADTDYAFSFHAGTARREGKLVSTGGRVLNAVGVGATLSEARDRAYELAQSLLVPGLRFRTDIASSESVNQL
jgi:phosphoribosylamine--glycine ligase